MSAAAHGYMRARGVVVAAIVVSLLFAGACSAPRRRPTPPAAAVPPAAVVERATLTCKDAAAGIERGTRDVREPDVSVLSIMRTRCQDDGWSSAAIACFAQLGSEDLAGCALELPAEPRERMFGALASGNGSKASVAIALARLATLKVGIAECDHFVTTVASVLACDAMPLDARAQLGTETADFWSLPTTKLSADAQARMAIVCGQSLAALQQQAMDAGCMP